MSYPNDNNPYGAPPPGQPQQPYGQPPAGQPQQPYGYPQQPYGQQPPGYPGATPPPAMPGQVVTARVLMFVAGGLLVLGAVAMFILALVAPNLSDRDLRESGLQELGRGGLTVFAVILFVVFAGLAVFHILTAAKFGKGRSGTRVAAIIATSLNCLLAVFSLVTSFAGGGAPIVGLLWTASCVVTLVFLSMAPAAQWFNRPQY
ncbi:hypothetical protein [Streptomyces alkaliterrae]|uniref:Uncharacterized protein n=1 Tax=Streptomyces alkaliterrae TaxID=2213162 RepID=A0A5P0YVW9_9ACTN|nr:hypothetical protein [Streptomyces alkaliterrae]MBB1255701.1 hypothetical protein [Streptomyces alkaliterrae]MBB1261786.1 hypothetical protein [Streptomyces alkaliterrae]MQS03622.1 hypothetical protein [Streptomyces alkaliterrae]